MSKPASPGLPHHRAESTCQQSIPIGLRKDPCSDSAGRKHTRLGCVGVESALHMAEGHLCRRARDDADWKAV